MSTSPFRAAIVLLALHTYCAQVAAVLCSLCSDTHKDTCPIAPRSRESMAPSAKKKALRRAALSDPGICDDATSATSAMTGAISLSDWGIGEGSDADLSPFEAALDALYEKRGGMREAGLETLATILACTYCQEQILDKRETLVSLLLGCLRRGGAAESALAARCLGLTAVNLGAGDECEELLLRAQPILVRAAKGGGKAAGVRTGAIEALALMTFIAADHPAATAEVMQTLEGLRTAAPPVAAAALRGWSLLLSTQPTASSGSPGQPQRLENHLAGLGRALDAEDVAVRQAAGEGAALLYSQSGLADGQDSPGDSGPATPIEELPAQNGAASSTGAAEMDSVVARMKDLATHRGDAKRRSKRDRSALKSTFRHLVNTVEEGKVAQVRIKLTSGDSFTVDSLAGLVQLNAVRHFLAEGFQAHLQANPLLHDIFGFQVSATPPGAEEGLTRGELRRLIHSPNSASSKAATRRRATARADSQLRKGASYSQLDEGVW